MLEFRRRRLDFELYATAPKWWARCECGATLPLDNYRKQRVAATEGIDCGSCGVDADQSFRILRARHKTVLRLLPLPHIVDFLQPCR